MVLGDPVTVHSGGIGDLGQPYARGQRLRRGLAGAYRNEIENREPHTWATGWRAGSIPAVPGADQVTSRPPSTGSSTPLMTAAASEANQTATSETSAG